MKQRSAEILCIGTEILMGDIINTNAAYIAKELGRISHYYSYWDFSESPCGR